MARTRPMITRSGTVDEMVNSAVSELECLKDELQEWADNMISNNMGHMPKYDELQDAIVCLEIISEPDCPELGDIPEVSWTEQAPYKGTPSRRDRRDDAVNVLTHVISHIEKYLADKKKYLLDMSDSDNTMEITDFEDVWNQYASDLHDIIDEAEQVEFPKMFG